MTYDDDRMEETTSNEEGNQSPSIKRRRLHPAAILFGFIRALKELVFGFGIGLILTIKESFFTFLLFGGAFLLLLMVYSFLSWWRFTYYIQDDELRLEQGIFVRKKRFISFHRIHKIDMTANLVHRLFRLTKVQIGTASSSEGAEVELSAIKLVDALQLGRMLKQEVEESRIKEVEEPIYPSQKVTWKRLFLAGSTSGSIGFMLLAILAFGPQLEQFIPTSALSKTYEYLLSLSIFLMIGFVCLLLVGLWLLGIAGTMIKYGHFIIEKRDKELFIKRGLIETKELTIPFDRIQAIGVEQSIIRQPLGYVQLFAVLAGGSFDRMETFPVLFPLMPKREVEAFLAEFVEGHVMEMDNDHTYLPKQSKKYYLGKLVIFPALAFLALVYFYPALSWIPFLLGLLLAAYGYISYRDVSVHIEGKRMTFQIRRMFDKVRVMTYKRRIQSLKLTENPLQRRDSLASIHLSLIGTNGLGTHFTIKHLQREEAENIADWFSYQKNSQEKPHHVKGDSLCEE